MCFFVLIHLFVFVWVCMSYTSGVVVVCKNLGMLFQNCYGLLLCVWWVLIDTMYFNTVFMCFDIFFTKNHDLRLRNSRFCVTTSWFRHLLVCTTLYMLFFLDSSMFSIFDGRLLANFHKLNKNTRSGFIYNVYYKFSVTRLESKMHNFHFFVA